MLSALHSNVRREQRDGATHGATAHNVEIVWGFDYSCSLLLLRVCVELDSLGVPFTSSLGHTNGMQRTLTQR